MPPQARSAIVNEIADFLAQQATAKHQEAVQMSPGSFQREAGLAISREIARLAETIRKDEWGVMA